MKKGTRVRVLRTNEIGTIACTELIRKNGQVRQYCKVKLDKNPELDTWLFANQLGDTKECATVTLADRSGRKLIMSVTQHYDKSPGKNDMNIVLKAEGDGNLRDHEGGLHFFLAAF